MRRVLKIALATASLGLGAVAATPASAAVTVVANPAPSAGAATCTTFTFTGATEVGCAGGFNLAPPTNGNLLSGTAVGSVGLQAIQALGFVGAAGTFLGTVSISGNVLTFSNVLSGLTIIGLHYGEASDGLQATSFFSFIAPPGTTQITVATRGGLTTPLGLSNAELLSTNGPVPEAATWAMMLLGFGGIGMVMRRSRKPVLPQLA
jgi:hypothetical protein